MQKIQRLTKPNADTKLITFIWQRTCLCFLALNKTAKQKKLNEIYVKAPGERHHHQHHCHHHHHNPLSSHRHNSMLLSNLLSYFHSLLGIVEMEWKLSTTTPAHVQHPTTPVVRLWHYVAATKNRKLHAHYSHDKLLCCCHYAYTKLKNA